MEDIDNLLEKCYNSYVDAKWYGSDRKKLALIEEFYNELEKPNRSKMFNPLNNYINDLNKKLGTDVEYEVIFKTYNKSQLHSKTKTHIGELDFVSLKQLSGAVRSYTYDLTILCGEDLVFTGKYTSDPSCLHIDGDIAWFRTCKGKLVYDKTFTVSCADDYREYFGYVVKSKELPYSTIGLDKGFIKITSAYGNTKMVAFKKVGGVIHYYFPDDKPENDLLYYYKSFSINLSCNVINSKKSCVRYNSITGEFSDPA